MQAQSELATIERRPLHAELAQRIRQLISDGELAVASRIPEKLLCERFGVSRTPLREALKVLAAEGWITLLPQRGAWVAQLTTDDLEQAAPVMIALESVVGQLACARLSAERLADFRALHLDLLKAYHARDQQHYQTINRRFHQHLLQSTENPILQQTYASLDGRLRNARYSRPMNESRWSESIADHEDLMNALELRDAARLTNSLTKHLTSKLHDLRTHLGAVSD